jgi:cytochrome c-type biogenesis protein CcmH
MKVGFLFFLFLICPLLATADEVVLDPQQEARAILLGSELRCVVCQSESINDSQADMARDMRLLVRDKIKQGWTDQEILDFVRARYGDFILLKPPFQANTYLLWALPSLLFAGAAGLVLDLFWKKKKTT